MSLEITYNNGGTAMVTFATEADAMNHLDEIFGFWTKAVVVAPTLKAYIDDPVILPKHFVGG